MQDAREQVMEVGGHLKTKNRRRPIDPSFGRELAFRVGARADLLTIPVDARDEFKRNFARSLCLEPDLLVQVPPTKTHSGRVGTSASTADAELVPLRARPASLGSAEHVEKPQNRQFRIAALC